MSTENGRRITASSWNIPSWSVADIIFWKGTAKLAGTTASLAMIVTLPVADMAAISQSSRTSSWSRDTTAHNRSPSTSTGTSAWLAWGMPVA